MEENPNDKAPEVFTEQIVEEDSSGSKNTNPLKNRPLIFSSLLVVLILLATLVTITRQLASYQANRVTTTPKAEILPQTATTTFQQGVNGYFGTTDSTLHSDRTRKNFGTDPLIKVQADNWILGTVRFDTTSIPQNAAVQNARLELYLDKKNDTKQFTMELYKLLRPWVENEATWKVAMQKTVWDNPGANTINVDREGTLAASSLVNTAKQWYFFDITSVVQGWVTTPSSNFGLIARGNNQNNAEFHFASANHPTVNLRPRLTVTFTSNQVTSNPTPTSALSPILTPTRIPTPTPLPTTPPVGGIWTPAMNISWHWMIEHALDINNQKDMGLTDPNGNLLSSSIPQVYDIDGFYNGLDPNCNIKDKNGICVQGENDVVRQLHAMGKKVICYIDAGVYENYRPDAYKFPSSVIGSPDQGWNGSYWLDIRRTDILGPIMQARMKMCKDKGYDAIEPDEIDGYENDTKFGMTYQDQINYNKFIARMAHDMGISIGLKGDTEQVKDLWPYFDWTLNEECYQYNECNLLKPFSDNGKAVFQVEYQTATSSFCSNANANNWNAMKMPLSLNGGRWPCR